MSAIIIDSVSGPLANTLPSEPLYGKTVKYGMKANVDFSAEGDYLVKSSRLGAIFTNVVSPFGRYDFTVVRDKGSFTGVNKAMLTDYGLPDHAPIVDMLKRSGRYTLSESLDMAPKFSGFIGENHVAPLFNMLRFYLYLRASERQGAVNIEPDDLFYDDGHVALDYKTYLDADFDSNVSWEVGATPTFTKIDGNAWTSDMYAPSVNSLTERELGILTFFCSEIKSGNALKLTCASPRVVSVFSLPTWSKHIRLGHAVTDFTSTEVYYTMSKFVFENRLQEQFDDAYLLVVMAMFGPLPRSIEANAWVSPTHEFKLPAPGSLRGMVPEALTGVMSVGRPSKYNTWSYFQANTDRAYVHGIVSCELLYTGLFEICTASAFGPEHSFSQLGVNGYNDLNPIRVWLESVSYRTGSRLQDLWAHNAGPDFVSHMIGGVVNQRALAVRVLDLNLSGYETYAVNTRLGVQTFVRARDMKPVLFPVLTMGINDDRYYINAFEYGCELKYDPVADSLLSNSCKDANRFMSIMRIAGYDVIGSDLVQGTKVKNWAANSNGQVLPIFRETPVGMFTFEMKDVMRRRKNWLQLPQLSNGIRLGISVTPLTYVSFVSGVEQKRSNMIKFDVPDYNGDLTTKDHVEFTVETKPERLAYNYRSFLLHAPAPPGRERLALSSEATIRQPYLDAEVDAAGQEEQHQEQM